MLSRDELATLAITVLDAQRKYFRLKPDDPGKRIALEASKGLEKQLRHESERILEGPTLFGGED